MEDLLYALFLISLLALVVGLINPHIVLDWLPDEKKNRAYVASIYGGSAVGFMIAVTFPSLLENLLFMLFFASLVALVIGLIKPIAVLGWLPETKRCRLSALMFFGAIAILSLALGSSASSLAEEVAADNTPIEQTVNEAETPEVKGVTAQTSKEATTTEEEAAKEAEEKAKKEAEEKAKQEAEEKAKKEAEEKAKQEAEAKAKKEAEEKAKQEAEAKAKKEAEEKAKQEAEAKVKKEPEEKAKQEAETVSQQNAIRAAKDYLNYTAFSKSGLIEQLKFEGYSAADATYAVESLEGKVDWDSQAVAAAQNYLAFTSFSRSGLIEQLKFEGFTTEQATYAANQVGL